MAIMRVLILIVFTIFLIPASAICQTSRAALLNSNVYRTWVDIKAIRLVDKNFNTIYNDTFKIKVGDLKHLDYKIISENENGFVIIRVLPKVKLHMDVKEVSDSVNTKIKITSLDKTRRETTYLTSDSIIIKRKTKKENSVRYFSDDQQKSDPTNAYN